MVPARSRAGAAAKAAASQGLRPDPTASSTVVARVQPNRNSTTTKKYVVASSWTAGEAFSCDRGRSPRASTSGQPDSAWVTTEAPQAATATGGVAVVSGYRPWVSVYGSVRSAWPSSA
jgi:hypothetical protein